MILKDQNRWIFFFNALKSVTKGKKIYHFQNVNKEFYEYQLGIYFDYFYIEGQEDNFLILPKAVSVPAHAYKQDNSLHGHL